MQDIDKRSMICGMFMSSTLEASVFCGDEIFGVAQISRESFPWKRLSLVNSHAKVYVFSDSVLSLGKVSQNPTSNIVWEQQLDWFKDSPQ